MTDERRHHYRKQANGVIRATLSRIREERQRLQHLSDDSAEYAECRCTLAELLRALDAMLALRKTPPP